jgi:hypothetical protein
MGHLTRVNFPKLPEHLPGIPPIGKNTVPEHGHAGRDILGCTCTENCLHVTCYQAAALRKCPAQCEKLINIVGGFRGKGLRHAFHLFWRSKDGWGRDRAKRDCRDRIRQVKNTLDRAIDPGPSPHYASAPLAGCDIPKAGAVPDFRFVRNTGNLMGTHFEVQELAGCRERGK